MPQREIRIDERWRICFFWEQGGARNVEIVDDHG
jgi:plasmid maintenance system killer protein